LLWKFGAVHPGEDLPFKLLWRHGMERDRLDVSRFAIGQHAPDDALRVFNQTADCFISQVLRDGFILRCRGGPS